MKESVYILLGIAAGFLFCTFLLSRADIAAVQTGTMTCSFQEKAYHMVEVKP